MAYRSTVTLPPTRIGAGGNNDNLDDESSDTPSDDDRSPIRDDTTTAREKESEKFFAMLDRVRARLRVRRSVNAFAMTSNEPWDRILRIKEIHIAVFSMTGLVFSMLLSMYKWYQRCVPDNDGNCHPELQDYEDPGIVTASADNTYVYMQNVFAIMVGMQIVIVVSSLVVIVLLVQLYGLKVTERQREWSGIEEVDRIEASGAEKTKLEAFFRDSYRFWDSSLRWGLFLEIALHSFFPILWFESLGPRGATIEEVAETFVFVRVYLLLRLAYIHSDTYVFRADILKSNKELLLAGYRVNPTTTFKIAFYRYPGTMIVALSIALLCIFSFQIFVVERNNNSGLSQLDNCFWFAFVTLSTIGYGDYTAVSTTGRVVVMFMATLMQFVMVLFGGVVVNLLSPTRELKHVQRYLEQRSADKTYLKAAVNLIETAFLDHRQRQAYSGLAGSKVLNKTRTPTMYAAMRELRAARLSVRQSLGAAVDSVLDEKLRETIVLGNEMNKMLHEEGLGIMFLHRRLLRATATIKQRLSLGSSSRDKVGVVKLDTVPKRDDKRYRYQAIIDT